MARAWSARTTAFLCHTASHRWYRPWRGGDGDGDGGGGGGDSEMLMVMVAVMMEWR